MRLRSSSIRAKIIALLLVPIVALTALWVYATIATTGDAWNQLGISRTYKEFAGPVDQYSIDLQNERRAAVQRLADPRSPVARDVYEHAKTLTDRSLAVLRQRKDDSGSKLSAAQRGRFVQILAAADQIGPLRAQVGRAALNWEFALDQYSDLVKPVFGFRSAYVARQSGQLPRQGTILIELVRAREYLSQEDAAMEGLRTGVAKPTAEQFQIALDALHNQQALFTVYIAELEPADQYDYIALRGGEAWGALAAPRRTSSAPAVPSGSSRPSTATPGGRPPTGRSATSPRSTAGSPPGSTRAPGPPRSRCSGAAASPGRSAWSRSCSR